MRQAADKLDLSLQLRLRDQINYLLKKEISVKEKRKNKFVFKRNKIIFGLNGF